MSRGILAAIALAANCCFVPAHAAVGDPVGVWSCVVYGDRIRGDERTILLLAEDGGTFWSVQVGGSLTAWRQLEDWNARGSRFEFIDPRTRRGYTADLERTSLGGLWVDDGRAGGWWCARRPEPVAAVTDSLGRSSPELFTPSLVPNVMASPRYPLQAIREAKEGRAVACFIVDANGVVRDPEILEISDDIFVEPTRLAMLRSSYRPSTRVQISRPGCREFAYELTSTR
jgi:hypothetical protein